jgi:hypothetical protein
MPAYDGKLLTVDVTVTVWGVDVRIKGTVEALNVRKEIR